MVPWVPLQLVGWLLVTVPITGIWLITAVVVSGKDRQLLVVEIVRTIYCPDFEVSALEIEGFCKTELKLAGPDHT